MLNEEEVEGTQCVKTRCCCGVSVVSRCVAAAGRDSVIRVRAKVREREREGAVFASVTG